MQQIPFEVGMLLLRTFLRVNAIANNYYLCRKPPARTASNGSRSPDWAGQGRHAGQVYAGDKGIERQAVTLRMIAQGVPEYRFQTDRGLVPRNGHAALDRRGKGRRQGAIIRPVQGVARHHQYMCWPPLIDSVLPVTKPPSSLQKKATPRAISCAWPRRPTGIFATIFSSTAGGTAATMSVSI